MLATLALELIERTAPLVVGKQRIDVARALATAADVLMGIAAAIDEAPAAKAPFLQALRNMLDNACCSILTFTSCSDFMFTSLPGASSSDSFRFLSAFFGAIAIRSAYGVQLCCHPLEPYMAT